MRTLAVSLTLTLLPCLLHSQSADLDNLYQSNRCFEFRDALSSQASPSALYRGELALAFHDWHEAEKQFTALMKSTSDPGQAFEAELALQKIYAFSGRFRTARALLSRLDTIMKSLQNERKLDPGALQQFASMSSELSASIEYPDQVVIERKPSRLQYAEVDNQLTVPLSIDGTPANYMFDTGSETNVMSTEEANRLGLTVHPTGGAWINPATNQPVALGVAIAKDVVIGRFHLQNVLFAVTPKDELGAGMIGLPVLLAFQTLRWGSDGMVEFGFPPKPRNIRASNLCFSGPQILAQARVGAQTESLLLDTGSYHSFLFPETAPATSRSDVDLTVGSLRTILSPVPVEPEDASGAHGFLGMDVLGKARSVTLDLEAMTLKLDGVDGLSTSPKVCDLPPDFRCASAWSCIVKQDDDDCLLDRVPVTPWPGNPVDSERAQGSNCILSMGASCEGGKPCRAVFDSNQSCHLENTAPASAGNTTPVTVPSHAEAAGPEAPADAREILQRWLKADSLDDSSPKDYVYLQDQETRRLNPDGSTKSSTLETREVMNLYDANFSRLISTGGQPLPPDKARAEQANFDKEVERRARETPEAKAKRQAAERKLEAESEACTSELPQVFDARLTGSESVNGRPAWIVELDPRPKAAPRCGYLKTFAKLHLKVWIDQQEYHSAKWEADNIAPLTWGALLIRFPTGGLHISSEERRHEDGRWLPLQDRYHINVKALLFVNFRVDVRTNYYSYRKFQSDSRILPVDGN